jgi:mitotic spindle assembly checkpoint protein MAD1
MAATRNQPTYDFITGAGGDHPPQSSSLRHSTRAAAAVAATAGNEDLRAHIKTLEFELSSLKQERELAALQHEAALRDAHTKADAEFSRAQTAAAASASAGAAQARLARDLEQARADAADERAELERRLRTASGQRGALQEELEEAQERLGEFEREGGRKGRELEVRYAALQQAFDSLRADLEAKAEALQGAQQKLSQREVDFGQLEAEFLKLKAQGGDADVVEVLKRDISEQVTHIRKLESNNRTYLAELQEFRKSRKSIEIVEEEKRSLEAKVKRMDQLSNEINEVKMRNEALESERSSWTSYLESQSDSDLQFDSPEELARAFMKERVERTALVERLGAVQPELNVKESTIESLEQEKAHLQSELQKLKSTPTEAPATDSKTRVRLERQKNLAVKESEYLRAQLKALDAEESEMHPERYSEEQAKRIQELEGLAEEYRKEVETLHQHMTKLELNPPEPVSAGVKRPREDDADERMGELLRKNRQLQETNGGLQTQITVLETEIGAKKKQLDSVKSSSRFRVLELKDNPTSQAHAIKQANLDALKQENETLAAQLRGNLPIAVGQESQAPDYLVPRASLHRLELQLAERDATIASRDKSLARLRSIFGAKGLEFKEAVYSLLGWQLSFLPNGKVKASSMYYPKPRSADGGSGGRRTRSKTPADEAAAAAAAEEENFIEFDGENGTMKVSGGTQSEFAREIRGLIEFWVDGKGQVPCFLAAMTLEFWEKYGEAKASGN